MTQSNPFTATRQNPLTNVIIIKIKSLQSLLQSRLGFFFCGSINLVLF